MITPQWKTYLKGTAIVVLLISAWLWTQADQWSLELEQEQRELALKQRLERLDQSTESTAEDEPLTAYSEPEPEPRFYSAPVQRVKRAVVKTKKTLRNGGG